MRASDNCNQQSHTESLSHAETFAFKISMTRTWIKKLLQLVATKDFFHGNEIHDKFE